MAHRVASALNQLTMEERDLNTKQNINMEEWIEIKADILAVGEYKDYQLALDRDGTIEDYLDIEMVNFFH